MFINCAENTKKARPAKTKWQNTFILKHFVLFGVKQVLTFFILIKTVPTQVYNRDILFNFSYKIKFYLNKEIFQ